MNENYNINKLYYKRMTYIKCVFYSYTVSENDGNLNFPN